MKGILRSRWLIPAAILVVIVISGARFRAITTETSASAALVAPVKRGDFSVVVMTSGELRALKDIKISGPSNLQQAGVFNLRISSLVPEGTMVKEGEVVAELDRAPAATKLTEVTLALQKAQAQYEQAMLDSTLTLSKAREDMRTMELSLEERRIARDQARYEAPSLQRQAAIELEKAERALAQAKVDYVTKTEQARAKMREVAADYQRQQNLQGVVQDVMQNFTIRAPAPGMVIYVREWNGRKRTAGSQVSPWDPNVATLPDLTEMESVTYVNEIDVRKVRVGQTASITLDADPARRMTGRVAGVANVGEQRPNADAKVFEVRITVDVSDSTLRPGMTTGNAIETLTLQDVLSVPIEAVVNENGSAYVYRQAGGRAVKQEVEVGAMNDDEIVIVRGLDENDRVLLNPPPNADRLEPIRLPPGDDTPPVGGDTAVDRAPVTPEGRPPENAPPPGLSPIAAPAATRGS